MPAPARVKEEYAQAALIYNDFGSLPFGQLESQLVKIALGDCTGATILDLGGGTGVHARDAIDLGARAIDIVDISPDMLKIAEQTEESLGRAGKVVRFFEADVSKPLSHLPLRDDGYDVVMANWVFSYGGLIEILEGMFRNITHYLKPGARFISVYEYGRKDLERERKYEKYGASCPWVEDIPGGRKSKVVLHCTPPVELVSETLEIIYSGSTELHERFGLKDVKNVPWKDAEIVRKDPDFWKDFLDDPAFAVVTAVRKDWDPRCKDQSSQQINFHASAA